MTDPLFLYLLKSSFILIILYAGYSFFLRRETYFRFNRFFLLFIIAASSLLPLVNYDAFHAVATTYNFPVTNIYAQLTQYTLEEVVIYASNDPYNYFTKNNLSVFLTAIFLAGIFFKLLQFMFRLHHLRTKIHKYKTQRIGGLTFVSLPQDSPTHSFFNWIFVHQELIEEKDFEKIVAHERIHAKQKHSIDLLIAEIFTAVFWFNPFAYLLKKKIKENHEYLADQNVTRTVTSYASYSSLLYKYSSRLSTNLLTHNFSYSLLKRRLQMMKKPKRPLRFSIGVLMTTTLLAFVIFACSSGDKEASGIDPAFTEVEVYPEFPGGMEGLTEYLSTNIRYPEKAKEQGTEGRVFINFIVEKDGSVDSAKVLKGIGNGCDEEALRVVSSMPDWTPGTVKGEPVRVSFNLPVMFALDIQKPDTVYTLVDTMPEFPGGMKALMNYLAANIKYPEEAKKNKVQGRCYVSFVIETDGAVNDVKLLKGFDKSCDEEALRVIRMMPDWKPGVKDGQAVRVSYNIPIKFNLE